MILLDAETRSLKRASIVMKNVIGLDVSPNTIERIALEVGSAFQGTCAQHCFREAVAHCP